MSDCPIRGIRAGICPCARSLNGNRGPQIANSFVDDFYAIYKRRRASTRAQPRSFATLNAYLADVGSRCWIKRVPRRRCSGAWTHRDRAFITAMPVHGDHCTAESLYFIRSSNFPVPVERVRLRVARAHGNRRAARQRSTIRERRSTAIITNCVRIACARWLGAKDKIASRQTDP